MPRTLTLKSYHHLCKTYGKWVITSRALAKLLYTPSRYKKLKPDFTDKLREDGHEVIYAQQSLLRKRG